LTGPTTKPNITISRSGVLFKSMKSNKFEHHHYPLFVPHVMSKGLMPT
jgi:hypothetical protein